jgi:hypothetical protein
MFTNSGGRSINDAVSMITQGVEVGEEAEGGCVGCGGVAIVAMLQVKWSQWFLWLNWLRGEETAKNIEQKTLK